MLIDCPSCARSYHVSRAALGESGRNVVCQICDTRWYVEAPRADIHRDAREDEQAEAAAAEQSTFAETIIEDTTIETMAREALEDDELARDAVPHEAPGHDALAPHDPTQDENQRGEVSRPPVAQDELSVDRWADTLIAPALGEIRAVRDDPPRKPAIARRTIRRRPRSFKALRQAAAIAACLAVTMGVIGKRNEIVRFLPGTGALYAAIGLPVNIRDLEFGAVTAARADASVGGVVEVSGTIHNIAHRRVSVPRLTFEVRNAAGTVLASWSENAPKRSLASEETLAFATKTEALPEGYTDIAVHFSDEAAVKKLRDIVAQAAR